MFVSWSTKLTYSEHFCSSGEIYESRSSESDKMVWSLHNKRGEKREIVSSIESVASYSLTMVKRKQKRFGTPFTLQQGGQNLIVVIGPFIGSFCVLILNNLRWNSLVALTLWHILWRICFLSSNSMSFASNNQLKRNCSTFPSKLSKSKDINSFSNSGSNKQI